MKFNQEPRTMARRMSMWLFLLVVWCSTGGVLMVVRAKPTVTAWIETPEADRKEGGRVEMRCVATKLEADHIVQLATEDPDMTLRWGNVTLAGTDRRLMFETKQTGNREITQEFIITELQRGDTDEYICNVNDPIATGGNLIVATAKVNLSVLYFPSESFPVCSPDGPVTADAGTQLNMRCSSEYGNSAVMMHISQPPNFGTHMYTWIINISNDTLFASSDLTVDADDHNVTFECIINSTYFPDLNRSCTIGPIILTENTSTEPMIQTALSSTMKTETGSPTAIIAGASAGGVTALVLLVILIIICRRRGLCNLQPKPQSSHTQQTSDTPDDTVPTTDQTRHSINIYQDSNHQNQASPPVTGVNIYYDPSEISLTASPLPEQSWHSSASPFTRGAQRCATPLYATPHRESTTSSGHDAREGISHHSTKQTYSNPVFDSQESDPTPGPSEDPPRPTAMVPSVQGVPIKPKPFKPKPQRVSSSQDGTLDQQDHQRSPEVHGTPPSPQQVHLDAEGGNQPSSSTNTGPVYASVMKNRAN